MWKYQSPPPPHNLFQRGIDSCSGCTSIRIWWCKWHRHSLPPERVSVMEGKKIKIWLFVEVLITFTVFDCLFVKIQFLLVSMKSIRSLNVKILPVPFQEACYGFPIATCDFKSCSESRMWFWKLVWKPAIPKVNLLMREKESLNRNSNAAFENNLKN
jgi:hypothetical protein